MDTAVRLTEPFQELFCPVSGLPDFSGFDPEKSLGVVRSLLEDYRDGIERMLAEEAPPGWALVEAETTWADNIGRAWSPISHLSSVADSEHLREIYNAGRDLLTEHSNWRQQHRGICDAYKQLRGSVDFDRLTPAQKRVVDLEIRDFHLSGVDLDDEKQSEYRDIVMTMSRLSTRFQENLLDATRAFTVKLDNADRLAGLPEAELRLMAANAVARSDQGFVIDLSDPSYQAIMTHARDRALRQQIYTAFVTRSSDQGPFAGQWDNTPVIQELLALRHRLARVLAFENFAEYSLATRMADSADSVMGFLDSLADQAHEPALQQFAELERFAAEQGAPVPLEPWDVGYWAEQYRQQTLHLSDEELKPYFPMQAMVDALFHVAGKVFEISLERDENVSVWEEAVEFFWVRDAQGNRIAGLYMDLFARQHKRNGAWMDVCRSRRRTDAGLQLPVAYLNCNFSAPSDGHPSLLTHHDVQTLFHEFGHGLHHMLTEVDWPQINGISNVEWDAVELPSQLLESWCWEDALLDGYARHYQTGETMPADLKHRLLKSRHFHKAMMLVRQLEFALTDFRLHLEYNPAEPRDPLQVLAEVRERCAVIKVPAWNRFLNGFAHIFGGGYSAGYYSYLWAEQLAADAWERFQHDGPFNTTTGRSLRTEIYAVGASRPAMDSFIAFRGHPPQPEPLLKSYGLQPVAGRP